MPANGKQPSLLTGGQLTQSTGWRCRHPRYHSSCDRLPVLSMTGEFKYRQEKRCCHVLRRSPASPCCSCSLHIGQQRRMYRSCQAKGAVGSGFLDARQWREVWHSILGSRSRSQCWLSGCELLHFKPLVDVACACICFFPSHAHCQKSGEKFAGTLQLRVLPAASGQLKVCFNEISGPIWDVWTGLSHVTGSRKLLTQGQHWISPGRSQLHRRWQCLRPSLPSMRRATLRRRGRRASMSPNLRLVSGLPSLATRYKSGDCPPYIQMLPSGEKPNGVYMLPRIE